MNLSALLMDPTVQLLLTAVGGYVLAALKIRFPNLPLPHPAPAPVPDVPPAPVPAPAPEPAPLPLVRVDSLTDGALNQIKAAVTPK